MRLLLIAGSKRGSTTWDVCLDYAVEQDSWEVDIVTTYTQCSHKWFSKTETIALRGQNVLSPKRLDRPTVLDAWDMVSILLEQLILYNVVDLSSRTYAVLKGPSVLWSSSES